ncbi:MAG: TnsA endonuclease N-terminal domain-containing protein [Phycisphaerae bacterium]
MVYENDGALIMALNSAFPVDPYAILDPDIRWYPGDQQEQFTQSGYARLLPPLVYKIRQGVKAWRNVLRTLSETPVTMALLETFKAALNQLTVQQRGITEICDYIKISKIRPFVINNQPYLMAPNTIFNKVVGNNFELQFAGVLAESKQIISFAKNPERNPGAFRLEYRTPDGSIENYFPDFIVKESESDIWLIETKGREDLKDPQKWARLKQWCADATVQDGKRNFHPLFVREEQWEKYPPKSFASMCQMFAEDTP